MVTRRAFSQQLKLRAEEMRVDQLVAKDAAGLSHHLGEWLRGSKPGV